MAAAVMLTWTESCWSPEAVFMGGGAGMAAPAVEVHHVNVDADGLEGTVVDADVADGGDFDSGGFGDGVGLGDGGAGGFLGELAAGVGDLLLRWG
jgi:hypothetical protein